MQLGAGKSEILNTRAMFSPFDMAADRHFCARSTCRVAICVPNDTVRGKFGFEIVSTRAFLVSAGKNFQDLYRQAVSAASFQLSSGAIQRIKE